MKLLHGYPISGKEAGSMRHELTDSQWDFIEDIFPEPASTGRPRACPRQMLDAILWLNNTGAKWRDLPPELGAWQTVFRYFDRWNDDGTLQKIVTRLTQFVIDKGELAGDFWCIDGTILRAHRCAAGGAKKGTTKNPKITRWAVPAVA
jgi:transposase